MTMWVSYSRWNDIPPSLQKAWTQVFENSKEGLNLSAPCPVCGIKALHKWYQFGRPEQIKLEGQEFVAKGALWEWCSFCGSYAHYSALVPLWWSCNLTVNESELTSQPEAIENAVRSSEDKDLISMFYAGVPKDVLPFLLNNWNLYLAETNLDKVKALMIFRKALQLSMSDLEDLNKKMPGNVFSGDYRKMEWLKKLLVDEGLQASVSIIP